MEPNTKPFHQLHMAWLKTAQSEFDAYKNWQELKEDAEKAKMRWMKEYNQMTEEERQKYATL